MAIKKDNLVEKAKSVVEKYKQNLSKPEEKLTNSASDISRIINSDILAGSVSAPDNKSTIDKKMDLKYWDTATELDPKNMAQHDEDVENLVMLAYTIADLAPAAASKLLPLFERQAIKVGQKKIAPEVIDVMKSKWFKSSKVWDYRPEYWEKYWLDNPNYIKQQNAVREWIEHKMKPAYERWYGERSRINAERDYVNEISPRDINRADRRSDRIEYRDNIRKNEKPDMWDVDDLRRNYADTDTMRSDIIKHAKENWLWTNWIREQFDYQWIGYPSKSSSVNADTPPF